MKYSKILLLVIAIILAGMALFATLTFSYQDKKVDTLALNDLTETVKENWGELETVDLSGFKTEMLVFNSENMVVYSTAAQDLKDINSTEEAMQNECLCLSVHDESRFLGTIVIPDPAKTSYNAIRFRLLVSSGILLLIIITAVLIYGVYVRMTIIRPFRKMEQFAVNVANGKFDEPLMLAQNNLFGKFTESFDIMREELKASRRRETALKLKEKEMIASLSHDLKTPITGIKLLCELLHVKVKDKYLLEKINNINQKAEQINVLVNDLLTSSLDDLGEIQVECRDESSEILHQLLSELDTSTLARENKIPECMILVDKTRLSQIIGNIIGNSYKYAGTVIDVGYKIREGYLEMSFRDYGTGVPKDEISLVTARFYRGSNASEKDGCGLGLYISSMLMERMNGELICSHREDGFLVTLLIPLS